MNRRNNVMADAPNGAFVYAKEVHSEADMATLRGETWRAMEDAAHGGKCRAIGMSNFTVKRLEVLRTTAPI
jgi:diketogulonate reductase-like aldo/keto reductase